MLARVDGSPARDLDELVEADRRARDLVPVRVMSLAAAILGLAVLILIHEAGHFFAARAVGMRPRKFYLGFGPPLVKTVRGGVEYGIAAFPLGGYVKIPGMHRPAAGRPAQDACKPEQQEELARAARPRSTPRSSAATTTPRARSCPSSSRRSARTACSQELDGALAPDAYWRQDDLEADRRDRRRPG